MPIACCALPQAQISQLPQRAWANTAKARLSHTSHEEGQLKELDPAARWVPPLKDLEAGAAAADLEPWHCAAGEAAVEAAGGVSVQAKSLSTSEMRQSPAGLSPAAAEGRKSGGLARGGGGGGGGGGSSDGGGSGGGDGGGGDGGGGDEGDDGGDSRGGGDGGGGSEAGTSDEALVPEVSEDDGDCCPVCLMPAILDKSIAQRNV